MTFKGGKIESCLGHGNSVRLNGWSAHMTYETEPIHHSVYASFNVFSDNPYDRRHTIWVELAQSAKATIPFNITFDGKHLAPFVERDLLIALQRWAPGEGYRTSKERENMLLEIMRIVGAAYQFGRTDFGMDYPLIQEGQRPDHGVEWVHVTDEAVSYRLDHPVRWEEE